jgi:hypothetical protein
MYNNKRRLRLLVRYDRLGFKAARTLQCVPCVLQNPPYVQCVSDKTEASAPFSVFSYFGDREGRKGRLSVFSI